MDFTTRMFLRDYAFIEALHGKRSHEATFQYALLATSAWMTLLVVVVLTIVCVALQGVIPDAIQPWSAPYWVVALECVLVVGLVGAYVDRKVEPLRENGRPTGVDQFNTAAERLKWWATTLSAVPLAAVLGVLLFVVTRS